MNLTTWRQDQGLISQAAKVLDSKSGKLMVETLKDNLPTNHALPSLGASPTDIAIAYGKELGFRQCIATLEAMREPAEAIEQLEAKFE